ncbi:hypothetical protein ABVK25_004201 [Lepraria finkii]|uniref:Uncharacterized protein n=1 Tax=Lepraria finkii TaxID=1340010 RepID=A0ABR4BC24_9LECA
MSREQPADQGNNETGMTSSNTAKCSTNNDVEPSSGQTALSDLEKGDHSAQALEKSNIVD